MEEEWRDLLKKVEADAELNHTNVLEKIKEMFKTDQVLYEDWKNNEFQLDHLLKCNISLEQNKTKKEGRNANNHEKNNTMDEHQTPLHLFTKFGLVKTVKSLVKYGADVNKTNANDSTPLLLAAFAGNIDIVKELINNGAKSTINKVNVHGKTPLLYAMKLGHVEIASFLIENGADVHIESKKNTTVIHYAAMHDLDTVKCLIELEADINVRNINGKRPLHYAAKSGKIDVLKYFIEEKGVDGRVIVDGCGTNLVQYAAKFGQFEVLKYLVEDKKYDYKTPDKLGYSAVHYAAAAPIDSLNIVKYLVEDKGVNHNVLANNSLSPMFCASECSNMEVMKYMLEEKHVNINFKDSKEGYTALYLVCVNITCNLEAVKYLVEKGANFNAKTKKMRTQVQASAYYGKLDVFKYLVEEKGARIYVADIYGHNELWTAVEQGQLEAAKYFIEKHNFSMALHVSDKYKRSILYIAVYSGNLDLVKYVTYAKDNKYINLRRSDNGWTPLHESTSKGYEKITEFLLEEGARVNTSDRFGNFPIHKAVAIGNYRIIELLLNFKSHPNIKDSQGCTPLHKAATRGDYEIVQLLVKRGANIYIKNNAGETALDVAIKHEKQELVNFLRDCICNTSSNK